MEQAIQIVRELRPLGVVFLGSNPDFFRRSFAEITIPAILITNSASELRFANLSSIGTDDAAAAEAAVAHLFSLGHRRIGVLGGWVNRSQAAAGRRLGVERAFASQGLSFSYDRQYESAFFTVAGGYQAMERLLSRMPDLTAVFAMADVMAIGAMRMLKDKGFRVPEDISVIGFDGIEIGEYHTPRLTTIRQEWEQIADRGVEILFACIDEEPAVHEVVSFRFLDGESTGKILQEKQLG